MTTETQTIEQLATQEYKFGFSSDVEQDIVAPGLSEDTVRLISAKKNEPEWMLEWRLKAFRHWRRWIIALAGAVAEERTIEPGCVLLLTGADVRFQLACDAIELPEVLIL